MVGRLAANQRRITMVVTLTAQQIDMADRSKEIAGYVVDALGSWGGEQHPESEFFRGVQVDTIALGNQTYQVDHTADDAVQQVKA